MRERTLYLKSLNSFTLSHNLKNEVDVELMFFVTSLQSFFFPCCFKQSYGVVEPAALPCHQGQSDREPSEFQLRSSQNTRSVTAKHGLRDISGYVIIGQHFLFMLLFLSCRRGSGLSCIKLRIHS